MKLPGPADARALVDARGPVSYGQLTESAARVAGGLLSGRSDLSEARVAFLIPPGREYVATLLGTWDAGGIAVPLALSHPPAELEYVIDDADVSVVVADPSIAERVRSAASRNGRRLLTPDELLRSPAVSRRLTDRSRRALMLYTSGTTGRPKGVVTTHANVQAQVRCLVDAWGWTADDRALLVLPLHHVHGLINVLCSALSAGAVCEMMPKFDAGLAWSRLASGDITLFTAVPTIYYRLVQQWDAEPELRASRASGVRNLRLMMSGSAALPLATLERWREISGHVLLERYGMTEIGMALSNPLVGERRPGFVGQPLPDVDVRIVDEEGGEVPSGMVGELEVRGPGVFLEYWRRPEATREAFHDGWFRTGDTAVVEDGSYRLLGRTSVDILKTGGFKVSALEIEDVLRRHPAVADCAVVGVDDPEWGQRVCAAIEARPGVELDEAGLSAWVAGQLAPYKRPRRIRSVHALPRNAMGKVVKPDVARLFGE